MMMRGTKEKHDELFEKINLEKVPTPSYELQEGNNGTNMPEEVRRGEGKEGTISPRCLHTDTNPPSTRGEKTRYRYDKRIGGWRRVY